MPLFEVEIQNRVVKGRLSHKRIRGRQGDWHVEKLYYIADSEQEVTELITHEIIKRRILGIPRYTKRKLFRELKVLNIRRLA